jgi:hypothetical protein
VLLKAAGEVLFLPGLPKILQSCTIIVKKFRNKSPSPMTISSRLGILENLDPVSTGMCHYLLRRKSHAQATILQDFLDNHTLSGAWYYPIKWAFVDVTNRWLIIACEHFTQG